MAEKVMLGLKLATDPRWVNIVEDHLEQILTDHAWCEQKAAANAISTIVRFFYYPDLVKEMTVIAQEEMEHFGLVVEKLEERGYKLGPECRDEYIHDLRKHMRKGGSQEMQLVEALLFAAMVEARSCERFRILSQELKDPDLKAFYHELMISEAGHYTTFIHFARKYGKGVDVDKRWDEFLAYEASMMENYSAHPGVHG